MIFLQDKNINNISNNLNVNKYLQYLSNHINNVNNAFNSIKSILIRRYDKTFIKKLETQISEHDASKYSDYEFNQYLHHFYPEKNHIETDEEKTEYDLAWLHHQNSNPHHWQYWVLIKDDNANIIPLDIPENYIIEMLCDWHSFSIKDPINTAENWYLQNEDSMILSTNTREIITNLLPLFKTPLIDYKDNYNVF